MYAWSNNLRRRRTGYAFTAASADVCSGLAPQLPSQAEESHQGALDLHETLRR